uniref:Uncharacterized protein n=1 Tax=Brassica oleracea TaxID=3712 RepID=A0A3P6F3H7_BRAOL|nr:unnamed protein product [Brassica oleracea]
MGLQGQLSDVSSDSLSLSCSSLFSPYSSAVSALSSSLPAIPLLISPSTTAPS